MAHKKEINVILAKDISLKARKRNLLGKWLKKKIRFEPSLAVWWRVLFNIFNDVPQQTIELNKIRLGDKLIRFQNITWIELLGFTKNIYDKDWDFITK